MTTYRTFMIVNTEKG